jgi:hypothetical protein
MWRVVDVDRNQVVERDIPTPRAACRAMWVFVAHEVKNGRKPNYRIEPAVDLVDWEDLDLPRWATE